MVSVLETLRENGGYRWDQVKDFVIDKPLTALVYSVAMKVLGFYCRNFFNPIGTILFFVLCSTSVILDLAAIRQHAIYKERLFLSIERKKTEIGRTAFNLIEEYRGFIFGGRQ